MKESLRVLFDQAVSSAADAANLAVDGHWDRCLEALRGVLSAGSKLHARVALLAEMQADEQFVADAFAQVDRAVKRASAPIRGDQKLPFTKPPAARKKKEG